MPHLPLDAGLHDAACGAGVAVAVASAPGPARGRPGRGAAAPEGAWPVLLRASGRLPR
jgi:hypothetical protein